MNDDDTVIAQDDAAPVPTPDEADAALVYRDELLKEAEAELRAQRKLLDSLNESVRVFGGAYGTAAETLYPVELAYRVARARDSALTAVFYRIGRIARSDLPRKRRP